MYLFTQTHTHTQTHVCTFAHRHTHVHTHKHTQIHMCRHTQKQRHTHAHKDTHMHIHTDKHTHINTHTGWFNSMTYTCVLHSSQSEGFQNNVCTFHGRYNLQIKLMMSYKSRLICMFYTTHKHYSTKNTHYNPYFIFLYIFLISILSVNFFFFRIIFSFPLAFSLL